MHVPLCTVAMPWSYSALTWSSLRMAKPEGAMLVHDGQSKDGEAQVHTWQVVQRHRGSAGAQHVNNDYCDAVCVVIMHSNKRSGRTHRVPWRA